jgi:hypothetical protein
MESLVTDAVAEALTKKITEQVTENLRGQWATIVNELASTRKSNELLSRTIEVLHTELHSQTANLTDKLELATVELQKTRQNNLKTSQILEEALKELGIDEE